MKKEDKELLLKDICSRLPYGLKASFYEVEEECECWDTIEGIDIYGSDANVYIGQYYLNIEEVKPYLFPLSSMTKEQYSKWCDLEHDPLDEILFRDPNLKPSMTTLEHHLLIAKSLTDPINYCYENHFDIYGLISKGLANDATGLNIY